MSTKSPVSTICLVAWAKRVSSRSVGGIWKKPGRKASSATTTSAETAAACEAVASVSRRPIGSAGQDVCGSARAIVAIGSRLASARDNREILIRAKARRPLVQAHQDTVGSAARIHDGETHEARTIDRHEQVAPSRAGGERHAVDQDGERLEAALHLQRHRL